MNIHKIISFSGQKVNTIYYNDSHGQVKNIKGFLSARDEFYAQNKGETNLTLSGGDVFLDTNKLNETVAKELLSRTNAIAVGNHDIGAGEGYFKSLIEKFNLKRKFVGSNIKFKDKKLNNYIPSSKIITQNGEKIGIVALAPLDFWSHGHNSPDTKSINIQDLNSTIKTLQSEIKKLEAEGINKIFLLSHTGETDENGQNYYDLFAKLGGIDVIIGGHDHKEVNRFTTSSRGEPVLICSTGRNNKHGFGENLDYFGTLELDFDDNGILDPKKSKSIISKTPKVQTEQQGKILHAFDSPFEESDKMTGHSELANLIADSNLWYVNKHTKGEKAEFALVNPGTIRDSFDSKEITEDKITSTLPFTESKLIKTKLTKEQILKTLSHCAKSTTAQKIYPGIMQVSGMKYFVNPDLSVTNAQIINPDGSIKYDLKDFPEDYQFTCVYDTFLLGGVAGLDELKQDEENIENFNISRQEVLSEYLKNNSEIADFKTRRIIKS